MLRGELALQWHAACDCRCGCPRLAALCKLDDAIGRHAICEMPVLVGRHAGCTMAHSRPMQLAGTGAFRVLCRAQQWIRVPRWNGVQVN